MIAFLAAGGKVTDAEGPIKDNLHACDDRWRALLAGQTFRNVLLKPSPVIA